MAAVVLGIARDESADGVEAGFAGTGACGAAIATCLGRKAMSPMLKTARIAVDLQRVLMSSSLVWMRL